ncbi:MAG TPA: DUF3662 and FHA domain-containing protein [Acidimicrobiia bacterium]|nr:DUF3662 and FHA domain-containing protein [Acidimicrobiia bacterium]
MGLKQFERKLEQLVEGAFAKAFRSGLQPVEIGRRIVREIDDKRTVGVRSVIAPNRFTVWVSEDDHTELSGLEHALLRELADYAREHARQEGYRFVGPVEVELEVDPGMQRGDLYVDAEIDDAGGGAVGTVVTPDGEQIRLGARTVTIGRLESSDITVDDPKVSRKHAEIRPDADTFRVVDLGSTNGTEVNGRLVTEHVLEDGDQIRVGDTLLRFKAS